jgi:hypothetical protein
MQYVTLFSCALAFVLAGANLLSLATVSWWTVFIVFPGIPLAILALILAVAGFVMFGVWLANKAR